MDVIRNLDFVNIYSTFIDLEEDTILTWPRLDIGPALVYTIRYIVDSGKLGLQSVPCGDSPQVRADRWLADLIYTWSILASASQRSQRRESWLKQE